MAKRNWAMRTLLIAALVTSAAGLVLMVSTYVFLSGNAASLFLALALLGAGFTIGLVGTFSAAIRSRPPQ